MREWTIEVSGPKYRTIYGEKGGQLVTTEWTISTTKNVGRANETTPEQQAILEAESLIQKHRDKGYSEVACNNYDNNPMLAQDYNKLKKPLKFPVYSQAKLDGCLHGKSLVTTLEYGKLPIAQIVNKKLKVHVKSFNEKTKQFEFKKIVDWFNNGKTVQTNWLDITPEFGPTIKCTKNHKLLTNLGWVEADKLCTKIHKIAVDNYRINNLIAGTLLGDSSIAVEKRGYGQSYRLIFRHCNNELFSFKKEILGLEGKTLDCTTGYGSKGLQFISVALTKSTFPIDDFYYRGLGKNCGKRRLVPYQTLKKYITPEALALWIADDGSLSYNNNNLNTPILAISTHNHTEQQLIEFKELFEKKFGVTFTAILDKRVNNTNISGKFIQFNTKDTLFLLNQLRNYHVKGVEYKFYFETKNYIPSTSNKLEFVSFKIKNPRKMIESTKFDIEVEDNHNYIANDILVHNCRMTLDTSNGLALFRSGKQVHSVPHIINELCVGSAGKVLDGEIYNPDFKHNFNRICSLAKKLSPNEEELKEIAANLQYWVYDIVDPTMNFSDRYKWLEDNLPVSNSVRLLPTSLARTQAELDDLYDSYMAEGNEGQIIRLDAPYENKRSKYLLKRKEFQDSEFTIIEAIEGEGNKTGMVGAMRVVNQHGQVFKSNMKMGWEELTELWLNRHKLPGQIVTIQHGNLTPAGIPRWPYVIKIHGVEKI